MAAALESAILVGPLVAGATAADSIDPAAAGSPNLLDHPRVDVAALERTGPDGAANLLVVDSFRGEAATIRLAILERAGSWREAASLSVDLATDPALWSQPWLVGLGGDRFALIVSSVLPERTDVVLVVASDEAGRHVLREAERTSLDLVIDDAGVADVRADGVPDLVIAAAQRGSEGLACRGAAIWVFADGRLRAGTEIGVPDGRLEAGVLGSFDEVAGDDLAVYAAPECRIQTEEPPVFSLRVIRLSDGAIVSDRPAAAEGLVPTTAGPPVRLDVDGDGRHELLAHVPFGLAVVDPSGVGPVVRVGSVGAFPLGALPVAATDGSGGVGTRVAWMEPSFERRGAVGAVVVQRAADGSLDATGLPTWLWTTVPTADRWILAVTAAETAAAAQAPPVGWHSGDPSDCPDLFVPTAVLSCSAGEFRSGPAWIGTRPLLALDVPQAPRILVAAALDGGHDLGLPATPVPWAGFAAGAWRHGPSAPFALAEVDPDRTTSGSDPGRPTVAPIAANGPAATLGGPVGSRAFVRTEALAPEAPEPVVDPDLVATLASGDAPRSRSSILRIPVPPGSASGSDRSTVAVPLGDVRSASGDAAQRWSVTAISLSDTGELAAPVASSVRLDLVSPDLAVPVPFATPPWPFAATLSGTTEPGATVLAPSGSPVPVMPGGAFTFQAALAPWPQTVAVTAIDAAGNRTVQAISVVGGLDYRLFPWPAILAVVVLIGVILSGVLGTRRRHGPVAFSAGTSRREEGPGPELEDLPPGSGL